MPFFYWLVEPEGKIFAIVLCAISILLAYVAKTVRKKYERAGRAFDKVTHSKLYIWFIVSILMLLIATAVIIVLGLDLSHISRSRKYYGLYRSLICLIVSFYGLQLFITTLICAIIATIEKLKNREY